MAEGCVTWRLFQLRDSRASTHFRRPRLLSAAQQNVRLCNVVMLLRAHYAPNLQLTAETLSQHCLLARARAACRLQGLTGGQWARARVGRGGRVGHGHQKNDLIHFLEPVMMMMAGRLGSLFVLELIPGK